MQILDRNGLKKKGIGYSRTHLCRLVKEKKFPAPIRLGDGKWSRVAWDEAEIDKFILDRIAERDRKLAAA
jgi:predicted DNA-binding transcriptional regulator AlpA